METLIHTVTKAWGWTGMQPVEIVNQNQFGNVIIKDIEGKYWRIIPESLSCEIIAQNETVFGEVFNSEDFQLDWNMQNLVDAAVASYGELSDDLVFFFVTPPVLGGEYDVSNIKVASINEVISLSGEIAAETNDLPDGCAVKLNVTQ
jgi:hypothetical protein